VIKKEEDVIKSLIEKYNDVLVHSMGIAISEDLIGLIISNQEDSDFELKNFINKKEEFRQFVVKEFFKHNNKTIVSELRGMEEGFVAKKRVSAKKGM
jgi:hypothetical protein